MTGNADIGLIGLGVMGRNLALNIADNGFTVAAWDPWPDAVRDFSASETVGDRPVSIHGSVIDMVAALKTPRAVLLMVKAGEPVDAQIADLSGRLEAGDLIVDGGNSHYRDTMRRCMDLEGRGLRFLGTGVSGGEEGARHGPAIMAGGGDEAYARVAPMLEAIAASVEGEPCCAHVGGDGAGHFVKMIHNGIEYADMQLIAEVYFLMKNRLGLSYAEMRATFAEWNQGDLDSYLIEITADILGKTDPESGDPMLDVILDRAGQKGTGVWSSVAALELGVPAPTIAEAVFARALSALKDERLRAAEVLAEPVADFDADPSEFVSALRDALLASKICAYAQGFAVIRAASREFGWSIDLGHVSTIWRGGCIIRARFLDRIREAYARDAKLANLLLDPYFRDIMERSRAGWRRVVATAAADGLPAPALASALAYFDSYRSGRLWADLIQAQRDYFGAHTFERVDQPGTFHVDWSKP
jgi:6-phosphogluconate dehydrogenase